ncbi:hypothetical protein [Mycolicibacterium phocaicum]|nr:hypothetical protein [Mycolicibacterium phocaicum]
MELMSDLVEHCSPAMAVGEVCKVHQDNALRFVPKYFAFSVHGGLR